MEGPDGISFLNLFIIKKESTRSRHNQLAHQLDHRYLMANQSINFNYENFDALSK